MKINFLLFIGLLCIVFLQAVTISVDIEGSGDFTQIQEGIAASVDGDTILVAPGTYYENINFLGKKITVASEFLISGDESVIESTVIDGNAEDCVVRMENGEDTLSYLCGFVIRNGYKPWGGGIYIYQSGAKLEHLKVRDNISESTNPRGGGIYAEGNYYAQLEDWYDIIIRNSEISGNTTDGNTAYGGGIYIIDGFYNVILENLDVMNNYCDGNSQATAGGVRILYSYLLTIKNCNFHNNNVYASNDAAIGGLSISFNNMSSNILIEDCQITDNSVESDWSGGGGIGVSTDGLAVIRNTLIGGNTVQGITQAGVGGIGVYRGNFLIEDCEITGNSVSGGITGGAGLCFSQNCDIIVNSTLIHDNTGTEGVAIGSYGSDCLLINSIIYNNHGNINGGLHNHAGGRFRIVNSIFWDNEGSEFRLEDDLDFQIFHSIIEDGEAGIECINGGSYFWGEGNLDLDPLFVDAANNDYHLQETSPGIDTGVNICQQWGSLVYYVPEEEIIGKNRDIGIYETGDDDYHFDLPLFLSTEEDISISLDLEEYMEGMTGTLTANCENYLESVIVGNIISWQPDVNWSGFDEVWIDFEANTGETYSDYILIQVTPVNDAPIIVLPDIISYNNTGSYYYDVAQYISDIEGQMISISATGSEHISVGVHYPDIILNANPGWQGIETITVYAEDDFYRLVSSDTMQVEVYCEPVADCGDDIFSREEKEIILDGSASLDPLMNGLDYFWSTDSELIIDNADSVMALVQLPDIDNIVESTIYLEVYDGYNSSIDSLSLNYFDDEPRDVECDIFPASNTIIISWEEPYAAGCDQIDLFGYQMYFEGCEYDTLQNNSDCVYSFYLPEGDYNFGVQAIYSDGQSDIVEVSTTDAEETELIITPGIHKVYPNPFNPEVTISFSTTNLRQGYGTAGRNTENTEVSIYNIKGQRLRELKIENVKCKMNSVIWDGKDDRGNSVGSGVYFVRFKAGDMVETRKMMLIK